MNYNDFLNRNIKKLEPSGIRKFFDIANSMKDVISLSVGEPDFRTPWHIRQAGIDSLEKGRTWYSPNKGFLKLRKSVTDYFYRRFGVNYDFESEVIITVGGSESIDLCVRVLIENGDEVLIPQPSFVCYEPITIMAGGTPVIIKTEEANKFKVTAEEIEKKITNKTKLLILPYPNNPTGSVMSREDLEMIADVVKKHNLIVLSDEIYGELTYGKERHTTFSDIEGMKERSIIISGFSKSYAMTGWRLGFALGPEEIINCMTKLHQFSIMSAPTVSQYAAIEALNNGDEDIESMKDQYDLRRRYIVDGFKKLGFSCAEPEGAFYAFPCIKSTGLTSSEFCEKLLSQEKVAIIPGTAFGKCAEGYVRVSYSYSISHIKQALKRIERFVSNI